MRRALRFEISVIVLLACATIMAVIGGGVYSFSAAFGDQVNDALSEDLDNHLDDLTLLAHGIVAAEASSVAGRVDRALKTANFFAARVGGFELQPEQAVQWQAVNQFDKSERSVPLPGMRVGDHLFEPVRDFSVAVPFVDSIAGLTGDTVTVFQRMNEAGDMLRVGTTVPNTFGLRATGTYIPAVNSDGAENPVISAVLNDGGYRGTAWVVDRPYVTRYEPIFSDEEIIGMIYVGVAQDDLQRLEQAVQGIVIGQAGYVAIVRANGPNRGEFVVSPSPQLKGRTLSDLAGSDGDSSQIQGILDTADQLGPQGRRSVSVNLAYGANRTAELSTVRLGYYEPWDWAILVVARDSDFGEITEYFAEERNNFGWKLAGLALVTVLLIGFFVLLIGERLIRPIVTLSGGLNRMARGNTDIELPEARNDEVGDLTRAVAKIREYVSILEEASIEVAKGNLDVEVKPRSDQDHLGVAFGEMIRNVRRGRDILERESEVRAYQERTGQAIRLASSEEAVLRTISRVVRDEIPEAEAHLMLADSSHAHLQAHRLSAGELASCEVENPRDCPAIRSSLTQQFHDSQDYSACPRLWALDRCAAICKPIHTSGRATGVFHVTLPVGSTALDEVERKLDVLDQHVSTRLSILRAFKKSEIQAATDSMTGLLNRRSVEEYVHANGLEESSYALIFADLDHFKLLNDTYGHDVGDRALKLFARVLKESCRGSDVAGRWGGEEFLVVLPGGSAEQAAGMAERVRGSLGSALDQSSIPKFTVSMGVADSTESNDLQELVDKADKALYVAKKLGRNRVVVSGAEPNDDGIMATVSANDPHNVQAKASPDEP